MKTRIVVLLVGLLGAAGLLVSQDEFVPDKGQEGAGGGKPQEATKTDTQKKEEEAQKKYDDILKDATKTEGPFTFWQKKKDVYIELDPSQLGKQFVIQGAFRTGATMQVVTAGWPINRDFQAVDVFRFERREDDVWLYSPQTYWRWDAFHSQAISAQRSFPEAVLDSYKIEAENPKTKKLLIKVNQLFFGELFNLSETIMAGMQRPYQLDREKSKVSAIKGYPENSVVTADLYYFSPRGGGGSPFAGIPGLDAGRSHLADDRSMPLQVTYLVYPRKESDYTPRISDPRVGYFGAEYFDHKLFAEEDRVVQVINRWNLKKKDPTAAQSEPVKPIVFYVDNSIPKRYREAVKQGILRWNKAFEKLGYVNAVQALDVPEGADWDHSDMRHNVVRMHSSENAGYAIALFRSDPFTGEILNASVNLDNNIIWFAHREYNAYAKPAAPTYAEALAKLLKPEANPAAATPGRTMPSGWKESLLCMGPEMMMSAQFGLEALNLAGIGPKVSETEYVNQFIADVTSHEVGHCLGLRHNFVASTQFSYAQLCDDAFTSANGNSASVMDYVPVNVGAIEHGKGNYYSNSVGPYDMFAIEYGYADVPGKSPAAQYRELQKVAAKQSLKGNAFQSDEQADGFDPFITRFDLAADPLESGAATIRIAKTLLANADKWYPVAGKPYVELVRVVNLSLRQSFQETMNATRFVGGIELRRNYSGDPEEKPTAAPVDVRVQRAALNMVAREMLSENAFQFSDKVLLNLTGDYKTGEASDAPLKDVISMMQRSALSNLLAADTVSRVANNAFKMQNRQDRLTIGELYTTLAGKVFSEIGTGRSVTTLRRELQRFMIEGLIVQALAPAGRVEEDSRMVSRDMLRRLSQRFGTAKCADAMTKIHIRDAKDRIDRALNAINVRTG